MYIELDPAIADVYKASTSVSGKWILKANRWYGLNMLLIFLTIVCKGTSAHLMKKSSVRRRPKAQIIEDEAAKKNQEARIEAKLAQLEEMQNQFR